MEENEQQKARDLDIEVTPAIEDAFYYVRNLERGVPGFTDEESPEEYEKRLDREYQPSVNAGNRLTKIPYDERMEAIGIAYKMLANVRKYGKPSSRWP